jgi:hypothetical protein
MPLHPFIHLSTVISDSYSRYPPTDGSIEKLFKYLYIICHIVSQLHKRMLRESRALNVQDITLC